MYQCVMLVLFEILLLFVSCEAQSLEVTSLPEEFFDEGTIRIVLDSTVWLYCVVNPKSPTVTVTWSKNGNTLIQDVPHIRLRSTGSDADVYSTLLLVIEPLDITESGVYQCSAQEGENIVMGPALTITVSAPSDGDLYIADSSDPFNVNRPNTNTNGYEFVPREYTLYLGFIEDLSTDIPIPPVVWIKDGVPVNTSTRITVTTIQSPFANLLSTTLRFDPHTVSDYGFYQALITDTVASTVIAYNVLYLHSGDLMFETLSPKSFILKPPEKLVLEIETAGTYSAIVWRQNGISDTVLPRVSSANFAHFFEIFLKSTTTSSDYGFYEAHPFGSRSRSAGVNFTVVGFDATQTMASASELEIGIEGEDIIISCNSTGIPIPTIAWTVDSEAVTYIQTDITQDFSSAFFEEGRFESYPGEITSYLRITNLQYSAHNDAVYVCTGENIHGEDSSSSTASIRLQVLVPPEVDVTADRTRVGLDSDATLTCTATGGNPMTYQSYTWTHMENLTSLVNETSSTLNLIRISMDELGTYRCDVRNTGDVVGTNTITIELGDLPEVTARVSPLGPVVQGATVNLVCEAMAGDLPISYSWNSPTGEELTSSGTISVTFSTREDYGNYTCTATNAIGVDMAVVEVTIAVVPIGVKMCFSGLSDCAEWINVDSSGKTNDLEQEIISVLNQQCQCSIDSDQITASRIMCVSESPSSLDFFSTINGTSQVPTIELLGYLQSWLSTSGSMITVQSQQLDVNDDCVVTIPTTIATNTATNTATATDTATATATVTDTAIGTATEKGPIRSRANTLSTSFSALVTILMFGHLLK